jgi:hypothetical protein
MSTYAFVDTDGRSVRIDQAEISNRGIWNGIAFYLRFDYISFGGKTFVAVANNTNVQPGDSIVSPPMTWSPLVRLDAEPEITPFELAKTVLPFDIPPGTSTGTFIMDVGTQRWLPIAAQSFLVNSSGSLTPGNRTSVGDINCIQITTAGTAPQRIIGFPLADANVAPMAVSFGTVYTGQTWPSGIYSLVLNCSGSGTASLPVEIHLDTALFGT